MMTRLFARFAACLIFSAGLLSGTLHAQTQASPPALAPATLEMHADQTGIRVSPMLYGLMTEEINYSYDGGLYGELIQNRVFRDNEATPVHWSLLEGGEGTGTIALDTTQPINPALPTCLKITVGSASNGGRVGAANDGYWGIPVKPNTPYRASFYAKAADGFAGPLTVTLESSKDKTVYARASVKKISSQWHQYTVTLNTGQVTPSTSNLFVISTAHAGTVYLNLISLFPPTYQGRANGNRIDLMQKLGDMKPAFLRLPGGNYLEGDTIATRFDWKKTIHGLEQRPGHPGPWRYRSSDGMGLLEFLEWCEDLHMQPLLAVFAGYALRHEYVAPGPALTPFVQDALDEIEYVTGDARTPWGRQRVLDGHPRPFPLQYVEIGNEDWFDRSGSYDGRFTQFYDAIKAKYPTLQIISTAGVKSRIPDVIDEHYYRSPEKLAADAHHYDSYKRSGPKIFVGEWASQEGEPTPDMNSALGDAAWMTGMERNSDIVVLEAYAPLLVNVNPGGHQWHTNLIGYDALSSFGSPSYYAQLLFSNYHGDAVVPSILTGGDQLYASITRDTKKQVFYVKMVNMSAAAQSVLLSLKGAGSIASPGSAITLTSSDPKAVNTIGEPFKVIPTYATLNIHNTSFNYTFAPYSITILQFQSR